MSEKLISEKWLCEYLDGYDVGALVKGDLGAFTMLNNFRVALMEAPAVDAVEVVRCGDCRYYHQYYLGKFKEEATGWGRCNLISADTDMAVGDYCSYGERREDNEAD